MWLWNVHINWCEPQNQTPSSPLQRPRALSWHFFWWIKVENTHAHTSHVAHTQSTTDHAYSNPLLASLKSTLNKYQREIILLFCLTAVCPICVRLKDLQTISSPALGESKWESLKCFFKLLNPARVAGREVRRRQVRRQELAGLRGGDKDASSAKRHLSKGRKLEMGRRDKEDILAPQLKLIHTEKGV